MCGCGENCENIDPTQVFSFQEDDEEMVTMIE
jgi:hypothetical protein